MPDCVVVLPESKILDDVLIRPTRPRRWRSRASIRRLRSWASVSGKGGGSYGAGGLGVEKIAISSVVFDNPELIKEISTEVGSQSVVVVFDVKKKIFGGYEIYTHNAKNKIKQDLLELVKRVQNLGAGEIVINSIDNDGLMKGYDLDLIERIKSNLYT